MLVEGDKQAPEVQNTRPIEQERLNSEATVKTHLLHLYAKLAVRDRAGAVGEAYRRGMLD